MREIKFKAKEIQTGDWKYGQLVLSENKEHGVIIQHFQDVYYEWDIDPKTVCQYVGAKDIKGEELYEWDLIDLTGEGKYIGVVLWCDKRHSFVTVDLEAYNEGYDYNEASEHLYGIEHTHRIGEMENRND